MTKQEQLKGFTLLELLIVIAILSILAMALILVLNPAETMRKGRDTQRMTDLSTLKTALGLYMTTVSNTDLDDGVVNFCLGGTNTAALIGYSFPVADTACNANVAEGTDVVAGSSFGGTGVGGDSCRYVTSPNTTVDGSGWLPVDFGSISSGSPISNLPLDPTNSVGTPATPNSGDHAYRYACQITGDATHPSNVFEIDTILESAELSGRMANDGGDNTAYYEVGTSVRLIGDGTNF